MGPSGTKYILSSSRSQLHPLWKLPWGAAGLWGDLDFSGRPWEDTEGFGAGSELFSRNWPRQQVLMAWGRVERDTYLSGYGVLSVTLGLEHSKKLELQVRGDHSAQPTQGGPQVTSTCPQVTPSPAQSQPQGSRSYGKPSLNHWALWSGPRAKSCQISKAGLFQQSLSQTTAVRVCSQSIKKYYTDVSS